MPPTELARQLVFHLGPTLVAALAGVRDRNLPNEWASGRSQRPHPAVLARLEVAYRAWTTLAAAAGEDVARAWFIGANPRLDEEPPHQAICAGQSSQVLAAAAAFVDHVER